MLTVLMYTNTDTIVKYEAKSIKILVLCILTNCVYIINYFIVVQVNVLYYNILAVSKRLEYTHDHLQLPYIPLFSHRGST